MENEGTIIVPKFSWPNSFKKFDRNEILHFDDSQMATIRFRMVVLFEAEEERENIFWRIRDERTGNFFSPSSFLNKFFPFFFCHVT